MGRGWHRRLGAASLLAVLAEPVAAISAPSRDLCPETCMVSGFDRSNWTVVAELSQLQSCNRPLVLDFSVNLPVAAKQHVRACNVWANDFDGGVETLASTYGDDAVTQEVVVELAWTPAASENDTAGRRVAQSVEHLQAYLANGHKQAANRTTLFATVSDTTVGIYVGAHLVNPSVAEKLFDPFLDRLRGAGIANSSSALLQACSNRTGDQIFGIIAAATGDFTTVHNAVQQWANGTCVDTSVYAETATLESTKIAALEPAVMLHRIDANATAVSGNRTKRQTSYASVKYKSREISVREMYCRTVQVQAGDDCGSLVDRCGNGLTADGFYKYNKKENLCSTLRPGQHVCCTSGELLDNRPKPNPDGSCHAYQVQQEEFCDEIAAANDLTVKELEELNKDTWGFNGCDYGFWADNWICLSEGTPRFPEPIANAVCGPQKPGSTMPKGSKSRDWAKLNPCLLNACCNIWGQCGTTEDFCIDTNTGPPGTAKKDTYGCISNCGMDIIQSSAPSQYIKLGYFEGFNLQRKCLNMDATQVDQSYTHIHFAFGMIDNDFNIYQEDDMVKFQFEQFKNFQGPKRIISFGGWVFSAEAPNYQILRNGVKGPNRDKLATNLVNYVVDNGLDGLDIDWEYPSAPDLPGIPAGEPTEARDYLRFLTVVRQKLPKDKSLSIAAPASFWYLKQFPIKDIAGLLDYIVYMTYDLHGQWDAGNKWSSPGCPSGNCLRSHINEIETLNALTMLTKAGVPSNKILVGVSSYGRSFQMADPSCTGPMCLYTGDRLHSNARKGRCTDTAGYISNAEISEINGKTWTDDSSKALVMVDGDLWVSYMDDSLKNKRTQLYKGYNMGGTIDWAVDLGEFHNPPSVGSGDIHWDQSWTQIKLNIKNYGSATCNRGQRTGGWVKHSCTETAAANLFAYTAKERWEKLECEGALQDTMRIWLGCHRGANDGSTFSTAVANFLHFSANPKCDSLDSETNCGEDKECSAHNTAGVDQQEYMTGACAREIWNGFIYVHQMLKNYYYNLKWAGDDLEKSKTTFISTFAPKADGGAAILDLLFSLLQIPIGIAGQRFFAGSLLNNAFFSNDASGNKKSAAEKTTMGLLDIGLSAAKDQLKKAGENRAEISFNSLYSATIGNWTYQVDQTMTKLFDGSDASVKVLTDLFTGGKWIKGKKEPDADTDWNQDSSYSDTFKSQKAIQRAFYAVSIPAAWTGNTPSPVVVDFGPSCKIDARKYFIEKPNTYNKAWRCPDGHSYILAGVRDGPPDQCGPPVEGMQCTPQVQWTLDMLAGIDDLQTSDNSWGGITVDDLINGAVKTYEHNGKRNMMNDKTYLPDLNDIKLDMGASDLLNVNIPGFIRIPVCGPEEIKKNLAKGRSSYGKSDNWPCDP